MTREEILAVELAKGMVCRGGLREPSAKDLDELTPQTRVAINGALIVLEKNQRPFNTNNLKSAFFQMGEIEAAKELDAKLRLGCGANFGEISGRGYVDGRVMPYKCPKCGLEGEYRTPIYELSE